MKQGDNAIQNRVTVIEDKSRISGEPFVARSNLALASLVIVLDFTELRVYCPQAVRLHLANLLGAGFLEICHERR